MSRKKTERILDLDSEPRISEKRDRVPKRILRIAPRSPEGQALHDRFHLLHAEAKAKGSEGLVLSTASTVADGFESNPSWFIGNRVRSGAKERGQEISTNAQARYAVWQRRADVIWEGNRYLSKRRVAQLIAQETDNKANTIRLHIRRPEKDF